MRSLLRFNRILGEYPKKGKYPYQYGLLLLLSIWLHIYYNWKPILSYLKDKTKHIKVFTKEFNIALTIGILFVG